MLCKDLLWIILGVAAALALSGQRIGKKAEVRSVDNKPFESSVGIGMQEGKRCRPLGFPVRVDEPVARTGFDQTLSCFVKEFFRDAPPD